MMQGFHDVAKDGLLGALAIVDAERQFALPRVLCTHCYWRQDHGTNAVAFLCQLCSFHRYVVGENAVREVGQVTVVRFGGSPGEEGNVILITDYLSEGTGGKVYRRKL